MRHVVKRAFWWSIDSCSCMNNFFDINMQMKQMLIFTAKYVLIIGSFLNRWNWSICRYISPTPRVDYLAEIGNHFNKPDRSCSWESYVYDNIRHEKAMYTTITVSNNWNILTESIVFLPQINIKFSNKKRHLELNCNNTYIPNNFYIIIFITSFSSNFNTIRLLRIIA